MKFPTSFLTLAALAGISLITPAFAVVNIDYVPVGNPGNAADDSIGSPFGAVAYAYQIGKYEVTNAQYTDFLNAADPTGANANGIYNTSMGDKPVNYVSWYDSARFTNWLNNGQGAGSTETGAYDLSLAFPGKSVGATVWLPSEDEWYKAAYYDPTPGAGTNNYWLYPTPRQ